MPLTSMVAPWISAGEICAPCVGFPLDVLNDAIAVATDILFVLSGRQFPGRISTTVRPCALNVCGDKFAWDPQFVLDLSGICGHRHDCGCSSIPQIELSKQWPLISIESVKVDGETLPSSKYRIDDQRWLVRLPDPDGTNPGWPLCQRLDLPSTEKGTWEVAYTFGRDPPAMGRRAVAELACQLALACSPDLSGTCRLPSRVTSVVRQGLSMTILDPFDFLDKGLTGLYTVDLFLRTVNPSGLRDFASVHSPDIGPRVRKTG